MAAAWSYWRRFSLELHILQSGPFFVRTGAATTSRKGLHYCASWSRCRVGAEQGPTSPQLTVPDRAGRLTVAAVLGVERPVYLPASAAVLEMPAPGHEQRCVDRSVVDIPTGTAATGHFQSPWYCPETSGERVAS